jgi:hypothetical protein
LRRIRAAIDGRRQKIALLRFYCDPLSAHTAGADSAREQSLPAIREQSLPAIREQSLRFPIRCEEARDQWYDFSTSARLAG